MRVGSPEDYPAWPLAAVGLPRPVSTYNVSNSWSATTRPSFTTSPARGRTRVHDECSKARLPAGSTTPASRRVYESDETAVYPCYCCGLGVGVTIGGRAYLLRPQCDDATRSGSGGRNGGGVARRVRQSVQRALFRAAGQGPARSRTHSTRQPDRRRSRRDRVHQRWNRSRRDGASRRGGSPRIDGPAAPRHDADRARGCTPDGQGAGAPRLDGLFRRNDRQRRRRTHGARGGPHRGHVHRLRDARQQRDRDPAAHPDPGRPRASARRAVPHRRGAERRQGAGGCPEPGRGHVVALRAQVPRAKRRRSPVGPPGDSPGATGGGWPAGAESPRRHGERARSRRRRSRRRPRTHPAGACRRHGAAPQSPRGRDSCADTRHDRQRSARPACPQHHERGVRRRRSRVTAHRPRSRGRGGVHRICLFVRHARAVPRAQGDGPSPPSNDRTPSDSVSGTTTRPRRSTGSWNCSPVSSSGCGR